MATSPVANAANDILAGHFPPFMWEQERPRKVRSPRVSAAAPVAFAASQMDLAMDREQVLLANLPLVRLVARSIHERLPSHVEMEDLVSAGIVGLIDAFNKFDAGKNVQFRSYAQFRIRGAILDSLRSLDWGSRELRRKARSIEDAVQRLTSRMNRVPQEAEIAAELKLPLGRYQELLRELRSLEIGSLQEPRAEGSAEEEIACLPTAPEDDPLYRCMQSQAAERLGAAVAQLPKREARVLALYYVEEMTLKEIGAVLGLVESRVSQIRASAIASLRMRLAGKNGERGMEFEAPTPAQPIIPAVILRGVPAAELRSGPAAGRVR